MFLPCPSVRPWGSKNCLSKKHVLWGFEKVWGVFDVFDFCPCVSACVRACVHALRSMY